MSSTLPIEELIDPDLPICDPHHHLWDRHGHRYLLDELLADTGQADGRGACHNVRSTVYVECASMYRADGPVALRPVGETEFVNGIAAMSASGGYGATRVAAGIVVLRESVPRRRGARGARSAHRGGTRALPRHPPCGRLACQRDDPQFAQPPGRAPAARRRLPRRASRSWRRWG